MSGRKEPRFVRGCWSTRARSRPFRNLRHSWRMCGMDCTSSSFWTERCSWQKRLIIEKLGRATKITKPSRSLNARAALCVNIAIYRPRVMKRKSYWGNLSRARKAALRVKRCDVWYCCNLIVADVTVSALNFITLLSNKWKGVIIGDNYCTCYLARLWN